MKNNKLVVFYGPRNIGKTSLLMKVVPHLQQSGFKVSGVISPPVFRNQEKVGIQIQNIATGEIRNLAQRRQERYVQDATPGYAFDDRNLHWGDVVLKNAVPGQVLIIDELGPLEIKFGRGWQAGVKAVTSGEYDLCIVVLREELHEMVRETWDVAAWVEFQPTLDECCFDHYLIQNE